ncbi:MAG: 4-hydroxy-tetrahydrodipicolinate reductase [Oscillospiraceae bacterium]|nr:4-hydroxy-tetrahydrodipicolinate reductase [Oscillospiraceae bacterium]
MKTTNIVLSGACGKMGRVIAELVEQRADCQIIAGIDICESTPPEGFSVVSKLSELSGLSSNFGKPEVIIDFSHPSALTDLLTYCKTKNIPLVAATTGYNNDEISQIKNAAAQIPVFFSGNMSLGINLLQDLAKRAVRVLGEQFDIEIIEKHHNLKKDAPSGTALMLADSINSEFVRKKQYVYDRHTALKSRKSSEIGIHAIRGGTIVGEHEVIFAGHDEVISLSHSALSKEVFAVGAINAAIFLKNKPKGLYDMSDLLSSI